MTDPVPFQTRVRVAGDKPVMAFDIMHALLRAVQHTSAVKHYLTDLAHDAEVIYTNASEIVGVFCCLRESGSHCYPLFYKDESHRFAVLPALDAIAKCHRDDPVHWIVLCDPTLSPDCLDGKYCDKPVSFLATTFTDFRARYKDADIH